jgi:hypothetical protein
MRGAAAVANRLLLRMRAVIVCCIFVSAGEASTMSENCYLVSAGGCSNPSGCSVQCNAAADLVVGGGGTCRMGQVCTCRSAPSLFLAFAFC